MNAQYTGKRQTKLQRPNKRYETILRKGGGVQREVCVFHLTQILFFGLEFDNRWGGIAQVSLEEVNFIP